MTRISSLILPLMLLAACDGKEIPTDDLDNDGVTASDGDCDDELASVNPMATDLAGDGIDQNCDGVDGTDGDEDGVASVISGGEDCDDADPEVTGAASFYGDMDRDGFGDPLAVTEACAAPIGFVADNTDCDDRNPEVSPSGQEVCDSVDNDCDGLIDDDDDDTTGLLSWYADTDADGYGDAAVSQESCVAPSNTVADDTDCDDTDAAFHPGADESDCADPADYNCDGSVGYADADSDGVAACEDCDDSQAAILPGATEVCDSVDNDCDGDIDEADAADASSWYADADADGYGDATTSQDACSQPSGYVDNTDDCNDAEALAWTGATETCDGADNNCDGTVDEGLTSTWYTDADGDGYGGAAVEACSQPSNAVSNADDCDDTSGTIHPSMTDVTGDGIDQNCDNVDGTDSDGDGEASTASGGADCADTDATIQSTTDGDFDGWAYCSDCDDTDAYTHAGAFEVPEDGVDQDCDGTDASYRFHPMYDVYVESDAEAATLCSSFNAIEGELYIDLNVLNTDSTSFAHCIAYIGGDLEVETDGYSEVVFSDLVHVGDDIWLGNAGAASYSFPNLQRVDDEISLLPYMDLLDGDESFPRLSYVGDELEISDGTFTELTGFSALTTLSSLYVDSNADMTTLSGFDGLLSVYDIYLNNHDLLVEISGFSGLLKVNDELEISNNSSLTTLSGFSSVETVKYLRITWNGVLDTISGFNLLSSAPGGVYADGNLLLDAASVGCDLVQVDTDDYSFSQCLTSFDIEVCDLDGDGLDIASGDCDDTDATIYPTAPELCDGLDNDCDTVVPSDEGDGDGDGSLTCADCNDSDATVHPRAVDVCDSGVDENCDGVPRTSTDNDGDGFSTCDGDCDDNDPNNTTLAGAIETCPASSCFELAGSGGRSSGAYWVELQSGQATQVYCELDTLAGGWTLFAITDADECAEDLPFGQDALTDLSASPYVTTALGDQTHTEFLQVFQGDGATTDFTIRYAFDSGEKTLADRFIDAGNSGESVTWTVDASQLSNTISITGSWWYSNRSNTDSVWATSGTEFSNDDGSWGAASGTVDGDDYPLEDYSDAWGHENPNSDDSNCETYWMDGTNYASTSLRSMMFFR